MSSEHIIIVARNNETGELRLPLGDTTMYGTGGEENVLRNCREQFTAEWSLTLYKPCSDTWLGAKQ